MPSEFPSESEAYESEERNGVLAQVHLTVGTMCACMLSGP